MGDSVGEPVGRLEGHAVGLVIGADGEIVGLLDGSCVGSLLGG